MCCRKDEYMCLRCLARRRTKTDGLSMANKGVLWIFTVPCGKRCYFLHKHTALQERLATQSLYKINFTVHS